MEINVEKNGPCNVKVSIVIPPEKVNEELNNSYQQTADAVAFPGFRKGKAPKKLVLKRFGDVINDDVKEKLLREAIGQAIEDNNLTPVTEPELDLSNVKLEENSPLEMTFEMEVKPEFEVGEYKSFEVEAEPVVVTDKEIDDGIKALQSRFAFLNSVKDQEVEDKHYVSVDMVYKVEGEDEVTRENTQANMSLGIIDGIEIKEELKAFVGKKVNDQVEIKIPALPSHFIPEKLKGKEAVAQATIKDIKEIAFPELDEDFLKKVEMKSVEELRDKITDELKVKKESEREQEIETKCIDQLIERTPFEIPEKLLMRQITQQEQNIRYELLRMGLPMDKVEEEAGKLDDKNRETAERNLKTSFIFDKIAEKETIYVTENEIEEEIKTVAQQQNTTVEAVKERYEEQGLVSSLRTFLRNQKIRKMLTEKATITEKKTDEISEDKESDSNSKKESSL